MTKERFTKQEYEEALDDIDDSLHEYRGEFRDDHVKKAIQLLKDQKKIKN